MKNGDDGGEKGKRETKISINYVRFKGEEKREMKALRGFRKQFEVLLSTSTEENIRVINLRIPFLK